MKLNDIWFGGEIDMGDKKAIIRARTHLKNILDSSLYNKLGQITWRTEDPTSNGIPTPDENLFMGEVEEVLIESVESDLQSVLTFVQTFDNSRTWFFYCKDNEIFMKRLNKCLSQFKMLPISITFKSDSDWSTYLIMLKDFNLELK